MSTRISLSVIALAASLAACDRAAPTAANEESAAAPVVGSPAATEIRSPGAQGGGPAEHRA